MKYTVKVCYLILKALSIVECHIFYQNYILIVSSNIVYARFEHLQIRASIRKLRHKSSEYLYVQQYNTLSTDKLSKQINCKNCRTKQKMIALTDTVVIVSSSSIGLLSVFLQPLKLQLRI
jgi:hypothetical protein